MPRSLPALLALAALALPIGVLAGPASSAADRADRSDARVAARASTPLIGTLRLTPGSCAGGKVTGTYLRMILPSGDQGGPFLSNNDSRCSDKTFTTLRPGTDGGLIVGGGYQPAPTPVFDSSGNARARRITVPATFYGTGFAMVTQAVEPQTRVRVPAPSVVATGTRLTADLRAWSVTWNDQYFNQGSPKPDGSRPGNTIPATGTYDPATGAFTLVWASQVQGGPFDKFTGQWHLAGTFVPARAATSAGQQTSGAGASNGSGATGSSAAGGATGSSAGSAGPGSGAGTVAGTGTAAAPGATASRGAAGTGTAGAPGSGAGVATDTAGTTTAAGVPTSTQTVVTRGYDLRWWQLTLAVLLALGGLATVLVLNRRIAASASAASAAPAGDAL